MKNKIVLIIAISLLATGMVQAAVITTIYSENFDGDNSTGLNNEPPTEGVGTWSAATEWKTDGTVVGASGNYNAFLAFTPEANKIYTLSATMKVLTGAGDWTALGFTETNALAGNFWELGGSGDSPWMRYENDTNVATFEGAPPELGKVDEGTFSPGPVTLAIELNTSGSEWAVEWFVDGSSVRSTNVAANFDIDYVALGGYAGTGTGHNLSGDIDSFSLTVVPEPSSYALLAGCFGLTWVMLRRRR